MDFIPFCFSRVPSLSHSHLLTTNSSAANSNYFKPISIIKPTYSKFNSNLKPKPKLSKLKTLRKPRLQPLDFLPFCFSRVPSPSPSHLLTANSSTTTSSTYFLHLLYSLLFSLFKKKKKKILTLPVSPYLLLHFFQPFPSLFTSISPYYSLLYHYSIIFSFLYFDSSSPYFILYKFDITSHIQSIFFQQKKLWVLSLSWWIFVLSYNFD